MVQLFPASDRKAMDGAGVLQEAHLAQAWALTELGWAAPLGRKLRRSQLESMCTVGSGKGWGWEGWGVSVVWRWGPGRTHYSTVQAESSNQSGASNRQRTRLGPGTAPLCELGKGALLGRQQERVSPHSCWRWPGKDRGHPATPWDKSRTWCEVTRPEETEVGG